MSKGVLGFWGFGVLDSRTGKDPNGNTGKKSFDNQLNKEDKDTKEIAKIRSQNCCDGNGIVTHSGSSENEELERCSENKAALTVSTIGLVVHSLADGIALGSTCYASQSKESDLPIIIFVALLLHKFPESIGFTTFLRHEGLKFREILVHLSFFAIAAPVAAIISYWLLSLLSVSSHGSQAFVVVGVLLLFSAGTFMYVAMLHILPEVYCNNHIHRPHKHEYLPEEHIHNEDNHYSKELELFAMISGLLIPYLLYLF